MAGESPIQGSATLCPNMRAHPSPFDRSDRVEVAVTVDWGEKSFLAVFALVYMSGERFAQI